MTIDELIQMLTELRDEHGGSVQVVANGECGLEEPQISFEEYNDRQKRIYGVKFDSCVLIY